MWLLNSTEREVYKSTIPFANGHAARRRGAAGRFRRLIIIPFSSHFICYLNIVTYMTNYINKYVLAVDDDDDIIIKLLPLTKASSPSSDGRWFANTDDDDE